MKIQLKIMSAALVVTLAVTYGYTAWKKQEKAADATKIESVNPEANQTTVDSEKENSQDLLTIPDNNYPVVASHGVFWRFANFDELYQNAEIVAAIQVLDQETVPVDVGTVSTRSQVEVKRVFKGEGVPQTLTVTEVGGVLDLGKLPKMDKPGSGLEPQNAQGIVETALESSPVMKSGNSYYVFLVQNPNSKWGYNIVGSVQGKLKIDPVTQRIANTVDVSLLKDDDTFFLQKQFAGKDRSEFEEAMKKSK